MSNKLYKSVLLFSLSVVFICGNSLAQDDFGLDPRQKAQKAQEYYLKGKELSAKGEFSAANAEFKKAQQLLGPNQAQVAAAVEQPAVKTAVLNPAEQAVKTQQTAPIETKRSEPEVVKDTAYYLKVIEKDPKNSNLYYNLALEYIRNNQFKLAAQALSQVIMINPKDADAYYNLGVLTESYSSDKKQAMACYKKYVELAGAQAGDVAQVKLWMKKLKKELKEK